MPGETWSICCENDGERWLGKLRPTTKRGRGREKDREKEKERVKRKRVSYSFANREDKNSTGRKAGEVKKATSSLQINSLREIVE